MERKIKIGYDAKRAFENFTGLGNYSRTLLATLSKYCPALDIHLYAPKLKHHPRTALFLEPPYHPHFASGTFTKYWRTKGIVQDLLKNDIQIYHGLSHEVPVGIEKTNIKSVVTIHDLIFKKYPSQFKPWDRWIYEKKFRSACERADVVVAISESTKQDILDLYNIPEQKVKVIYQSIHEQFFKNNAPKVHAETRLRLRIPSSYFLYVGSVIPRKNLQLLVEAYKTINDTDFPPLLIVGQGGAYKQAVVSNIDAHQLQQQIFFLDEVSFADLPALYQGATALCYPSIYEGFGLPVVEALSQSTPVITYRGSSLPEAAGPGALYLDHLKAEELAQLLIQLYRRPKEAEQLAQAGRQHIRRFEAELLSQQWQKLYQNLVK